MTFGGKNFRIAGTEGWKNEYFADETSTNIRDIAIYMRNAKIEDADDITIVPVSVAEAGVWDLVNELVKWVSSGDDLYDMSLTHAHTTGMLLSKGYIQNWSNFKYNDFSKDYWINDINKREIVNY